MNTKGKGFLPQPPTGTWLPSISSRILGGSESVHAVSGRSPFLLRSSPSHPLYHTLSPVQSPKSWLRRAILPVVLPQPCEGSYMKPAFSCTMQPRADELWNLTGVVAKAPSCARLGSLHSAYSLQLLGIGTEALFSGGSSKFGRDCPNKPAVTCPAQ
jgi:hypothetical protein